ncbi:MAG: ASKHA domain-containing protein [Planctomycetota bacterium]|jgi:uncharacterized 2Fe-2S/4Fe-4S cluster protein (DUF4445 family)
MADAQVKVTLQPQGRAVFVLPGTKVIEAAGRAGLAIETPCGGSGTCGKCRVRLTSGAPEPSVAARKFFSDSELAEGWRLACQAAADRDCVVTVPTGSLFGIQQKILAERQKGLAEEVIPAVRKIYVELAEPTLEDNQADLVRLSAKIGGAKADLAMLRRLGGLLRESGFRGTAVLCDHDLIDFEPGDTTAECFGLAFDVGTTTVVGSLLNLCNGAELALVSGINPQVSYGDDVLSRILRSGESDKSFRMLREQITSAVAEMVGQLCERAAVKAERIYEVAFAGNTTMEHLLCGVDVRQLGEVPFVPAHERGLIVPARELSVPVNPRAAAYVFPVIGGFVGGDTVAGITATKLDELDGPVVMVDIGTNGEIVLASEGRLLAASTAAGPAFEGARISCGMRASTGAIEKVLFDDDVRFSVIGGGGPAGICGSALIDLAAGLLGCGIISPSGRLLPPGELPGDLPEALRRRVRSDDGQSSFVVAEPAHGPPVSLSQRDVRELQLATGAIRAGLNILLRRANLASAELKRVLIAGGFGSFIRRSNAQRIGLLPPDVQHSRITYVGNASLDGAKCALLSTRARKKAEEIARRAEHVQLSKDPDFQKEFAEAMIFPSGS